MIEARKVAANQKTVSVIPAALLLFCLIIFSCVIPKQVNTPKPKLKTTIVDLSPIHIGMSRDVVISPRKKPVKSVIVVIGKGSAEKVVIHNDWARIVRRELIREGVDVIVGEVRARIEELNNGKLQTRKENLGEAEKLVLLGKKTGADAILVFDYLGLTRIGLDVHVYTGNADTTRLTYKEASGKKTPECPYGFRTQIPVLVAKGRLVDPASATIMAEFYIGHPIYRRKTGLRTKMHVYQSDYKPVWSTGIGNQSGCESKEYRYISSWEKVDMSCKQIEKTVATLVPSFDSIESRKLLRTGQDILREIVRKVFK